MRFSVAICTWNRARLLDQTLQSMRGLQVPAGLQWELLIVNNRCTDDTDAVIARYTGQLPIRRLFEPKQGHCNSRNCAVDAAEGEVLVWTDDDVLVQPQWLAEYVRAAQAWPEASYFGGLIQPHFEVPPPAWITENLQYLQGPLVIRDFGARERPFEAGERPFGANMAFRTSVLRAEQFDPRLGLQGSNNIRGDETAMFAALRARGAVGVWVPTAALSHVSPGDRLTLRYMRDFFHGIGRTEIRTDGIPAGKRLWGAPRWLYRQWLMMAARACWQRYVRRSGWVRSYITASRLRGMIVESRYQAARQAMQLADPGPRPAPA